MSMLNKITMQQVNDSVAEMRKSPEMVDAALGFVARTFNLLGYGCMTKNVAKMQNELICVFSMCPDYEVSEFDQSGIFLEQLMESAFEIDDVARIIAPERIDR